MNWTRKKITPNPYGDGGFVMFLEVEYYEEYYFSINLVAFDFQKYVFCL